MSSHKNIRLLSWFNFCVDFVPFAPFAILYFSDTTGSFASGMSIFSLVMLSSALFEIPTGIFSDRIGRRRTIILGAVASLTSSVVLAIGGSYGVLAVSAVLAGLARSFYSGNNEALLYDSLVEEGTSEQYDRVLGKTSAMFQVALGTSTLVGSAAVFLWSIQAAVWIAVIPKIAELVISFFFVEPRVHSKKSGNIFHHLSQSLQQFRSNRHLRVMAIASSIRFALSESGYSFRPAVLELLWPRWALGLSSLLSNIGAGIGFWISHRVIRRYSLLSVLRHEIIINRLINVPVLVFPSVITPIILSGTSFLYGIAQVAGNTLLQKEFTSAQRATLGSITSLGGSLLFAVLSVSLGFLADYVGPIKTILLIQLLFLPLLLFYKSLERMEA